MPPLRTPLFHVVLLEPEIPNNTGNIGRTCVATACALHLVGTLGFDTDEKACRRAGLDYWPRLSPRLHASWPDYIESQTPKRLWLFSTRAARPVWDADLRAGDHLVFGKETRGLPDSLLDQYPDRRLVLPMAPNERSLNLAAAVCAAVFEGLRQLRSRGEVSLGSDGRLQVGGVE